MKNQINKLPKENSASKKKVVLPIIALLFEISPFVFVTLRGVNGVVLLLLLILPIVGFVLGVSSIRKGKAEIGIVGMIIAIIAVALPILMIGSIIVFFIGATTGIISFM